MRNTLKSAIDGVNYLSRIYTACFIRVFIDQGDVAMEMPESIETLKAQMHAKIKALGKAGLFMSGTFVRKRRVCGNPACACAKGGEAHPACAVTSKVAGKTKAIYIPVGIADEVEAWTSEYKRVKKLLKEIDVLAEKVVRLHVPRARAAKRRNASLASTTATSSES